MRFSSVKIITNLLAVMFGLMGTAVGQPAQKTFGTPPDSLFKEARYPANPEVPYIYSLKELNVTFEEADGSIIAVMDYHVRVKVFDASAPQASIVGIPFYAKNNVEQITAIHGVTWQSPSEGIPLQAQNIRTINLNSRYKLKEFTMPNVQDGSVIEYSYQIRRRYIEELPAFYLANKMPTVLSKVTITYPQYLRYNAIIEDFSRKVEHEIIKKPVVDLPEIFTNPQPDPILKEVWVARNVPAVQKEKFISTLDDYRGKISFQLSGFGIPRQPLENSWKFVVEEIRQRQKLFETIKSNKKANKVGQSIRQAVNSKVAAQDSIFQYLLKQVSYNGRRAPFSSVPAREVLNGEESNQAAINQTLVSMLRGAGIKAHPVLISTRKSGKINKGYPSFFQFNGQLAWSKIDGKTYLMDASFDHSQPNLIPVETYNQTGLLLTNHDFRWIEINPTKSVFSISINMDAKLKRDGSLSGHITSKYRGYPARQVRIKRANGASPRTVVQRLLFDSYMDIQFSDVTVEHKNSYHHPAKISARFTIPTYATAYTGGLRFRPMVVGYLMDNPFDNRTRQLPVTLDAPEKLHLVYNLRLPENYTLKHIPEDQTIRLPGAVFKERYDMENGVLHYEFHINIAENQFSAALYPQLSRLYQHWVQLSRLRWFVE